MHENDIILIYTFYVQYKLKYEKQVRTFIKFYFDSKHSNACTSTPPKFLFYRRFYKCIYF